MKTLLTVSPIAELFLLELFLERAELSLLLLYLTLLLFGIGFRLGRGDNLKLVGLDDFFITQ